MKSKGKEGESKENRKKNAEGYLLEKKKKINKCIIREYTADTDLLERQN